MRVALVHDWLLGMRGGERVLEELCRLFPAASVYTLFHKPGAVSPLLESMPIHASVLNRVPGARRYYRHMLPLFPWTISRFDLSSYDLVLSISHTAAKGVAVPAGVAHICYCLTPMRFLWDMQQDYFHYGDPLRVKRTVLRALTPPLRLWDRTTARRVHHFIAASRHVQERISRYYDREAELIYPPADTEFFTPAAEEAEGQYYLLVSALLPYKRVDIAIEAFNRLGYPLVIVGGGPDLERLRRNVAPNIRFMGCVTNDDLRGLYRYCRAAIIPGREDFGLVALEAQACGRPPVAYAGGGALVSVIDGESGILFGDQTAAGLIEGIRRLERTRFVTQRLRANAERFSKEAFRKAILRYVAENCGRRIPASTRSAREPAFGAVPAGFDWDHPSLNGVGGLAKRAIDIVLSLCGLLATALPLIIIAFLIRRDSAGPALFFQTRLGLRGRRFLMVKFRTMYVEAERDTGPTFAREDDPRSTQVGRVLRRYCIDELPQLWNVLVGDMSLVGPRPERPEFQRVFEERFPGFRRRLQVQAGLSGLAQVRGWRGNTSMEKRIESDLDYIAHWSFWQDLLILLRTPLSLLPGNRAIVSRYLADDATPID